MHAETSDDRPPKTAPGDAPLPAAVPSGCAGGLVALVDPVSGLPFAVHRSRLAREAGGREADHMVSPWGNLLDVSGVRAAVVGASLDPGAPMPDPRRWPGWGPPCPEGPARRAPSLAAFVNDARAGGFSLVKVWRTARDVMVSYGEGDPRVGTLHAARVAWFGLRGEAEDLVAETFREGVIARQGDAHPLGVIILRDRQGADVFLAPRDAVPVPMRPDVEGMLDAASSTGVFRFTLSVSDGLDSLVVEYPAHCAVRHCARMSWRGDVEDASEAIARMRAGDLGSGPHRTRVEAAGEGWVRVAMPLLDAMRGRWRPPPRKWGYPVPASVRCAASRRTGGTTA